MCYQAHKLRTQQVSDLFFRKLFISSSDAKNTHFRVLFPLRKLSFVKRILQLGIIQSKFADFYSRRLVLQKWAALCLCSFNLLIRKIQDWSSPSSALHNFVAFLPIPGMSSSDAKTWDWSSPSLALARFENFSTALFGRRLTDFRRKWSSNLESALKKYGNLSPPLEIGYTHHKNSFQT